MLQVRLVRRDSALPKRPDKFAARKPLIAQHLLVKSLRRARVRTSAVRFEQHRARLRGYRLCKRIVLALLQRPVSVPDGKPRALTRPAVLTANPYPNGL